MHSPLIRAELLTQEVQEFIESQAVHKDGQVSQVVPAAKYPSTQVHTPLIGIELVTHPVQKFAEVHSVHNGEQILQLVSVA